MIFFQGRTKEVKESGRSGFASHSPTYLLCDLHLGAKPTQDSGSAFMKWE